MDENIYLWILLSAALVTYPLRLIPAVFISKLHLSAFMQRFLDYVPYTALTALVFPGVFDCLGTAHVTIAYLGTATAVLCAILKLPLSVAVVVAVVAVYLLLLL